MKITCSGCGRTISSENINLSTLTATCVGCNAVFSFADDMTTNYPDNSDFIELPLPKRMKLINHANELVIERKWLRDSPGEFLTIFVVFTIILIMFLIFNLIIPFLVISAVTILAVYSAITEFHNTTTIRIDRQKITLRHEPFPRRSEKVFDMQSIKSIYLEKNLSLTQTRQYYCKLFFVKHDDTRQKFFFFFGSYYQGLFIEQEINKFIRSQM